MEGGQQGGGGIQGEPQKNVTSHKIVVSRGAVRSAASSYAAIRMVAGSRPDLVIA